MKLSKLLCTFLITCFSMSGNVFAQSVSFYENWASPRLSVAGTYFNDMANITNPSGKWLINSEVGDCLDNLPGPNSCYNPSGGVLYFHGDFRDENHGGRFRGEGVLLVSKDKISFNTGFQVSTNVKPYCTPPVAINKPNDTPFGGCWVNVGIYDGEKNYRSIGFYQGSSGGWGAGAGYVWGPTYAGHLGFFQWPRAANYNVTINYQVVNAGQSRWSYYINGQLVGQELVGMNDANRGFFQDKKAHVELGFGGYDWYTNGASAAEGTFGPVTASSW